MNYQDTVFYLTRYFLDELSEFRTLFGNTPYSLNAQRKALRGLLNVRRSIDFSEEILDKIDFVLSVEKERLTPISPLKLPSSNYEKIGLFEGDITQIVSDVIVNPASATLMGCYVPGHNCLDNRIHSMAGPRLRIECSYLRDKIGRDEKPGNAHLTKGYNLFSKYVIHAVGPSFRTRPSNKDNNELSMCYKKSLEICEANGLRTIVFPPISVGLNGYNSISAAKIAVNSVLEYLNDNPNGPIVIFCVEKEEDIKAYHSLLCE